MSGSAEIKAAYNNGLGKGTAQGRLIGRLEAYLDIERYLDTIASGIPRYESPQYIKQALLHCRKQIANLERSAPSKQDNIEKVKEVADQLRRQRDGG